MFCMVASHKKRQTHLSNSTTGNINTSVLLSSNVFACIAMNFNCTRNSYSPTDCSVCLSTCTGALRNSLTPLPGVLWMRSGLHSLKPRYPRAPSTCAAHLRSIIIVRILHTLVPAAVVVVIQRLCPVPVVAGANAGHGAERAGQLPPRATAVMLRAAAVRSWHRRDALRAQNQQKAHGFPEIKVTATRERAVFGGVRQVWDGDGREIHKVLALRFHH